MFVTVGATGDLGYITDGTADDVQIQAAITNVAALGGGTVYIQAGTHRIAATIVIPFDAHVRVIGAKFAQTNENVAGTTLKTAAGVTLTNMFEMYGKGPGSPSGEGGGTNGEPNANTDLTHDIQFEHMTINGNNSTTNNFYLENFGYARFETCRIIAATTSIKTHWNGAAFPVSATVPGGIWANNCIISANSGNGVELHYQTQCWFTNTWFSGSSVSNWFKFTSSNKIHLTNCEFNTATNVSCSRM